MSRRTRRRTDGDPARREPVDRRSAPPARRPATPTAGVRARLATDRFLVACLAVVTALVFVPSVFNEFLDYDDPAYVTDNEVVKRGLVPAGVVWAFTTGHFLNWLPITWLSHMLDVTLFGLDPRGHHLTSVLLHAVNAALALAALRSLTGSRWRSLAVAAVFAVHPLRVESVAWIAERKDVLAGTFFLLTLLAYARYAGRPAAGRYLLVLGVYAAGLMSKTMLVTVPCVLLLLDWWPLGRLRAWAPIVDPNDPAALAPAPPRAWWWLAAEKVPMLALAAAASAWTVVLQRAGGAAAEQFTLAQRAANAAVAVWRYAGKIAVPLDLSPYYQHPGWWPAWAVAAAAAGLVLVTAAAAWAGRRRPYVLVGWLWYVGMLVPVSGLTVQVGAQSMADRYTYLPGLGLTLAAVWLAAAAARDRPPLRRLAVGGAAVAVPVLAALAVVQQPVWRTDLDLFARVLAVEPTNWMGHWMIGRQFRDRHGRPDLAVEHFRAALAAEPGYGVVRIDLGTTLLMTRATGEAVAEFREVARQTPTLAEPRIALARALHEDRRFAEADAEFAAAVALKPDAADAHAQWALALARQGRRPEAVDRADAALRLDPQNEIAKLARSLAGEGPPSQPAGGR